MSVWMIFVLMFVAIGWIGNRGNRWNARDTLSAGADEETRRELARVREMVEDLSSRFHVLETERDFYRELLDSPESPAAQTRALGSAPVERTEGTTVTEGDRRPDQDAS